MRVSAVLDLDALHSHAKREALALDRDVSTGFDVRIEETPKRKQRFPALHKRSAELGRTDQTRLRGQLWHVLTADFGIRQDYDLLVLNRPSVGSASKCFVHLSAHGAVCNKPLIELTDKLSRYLRDVALAQTERRHELAQHVAARTLGPE